MLCQVLGAVILDADGNRLAVKYFPSDNSRAAAFRDYSAQIKFEANLMQKANRITGRTEVEVVMVNDYLALFRSVNDVCIFIIGDLNENELILLEVINAVFQGLNSITSGQVGKRQLLENLDSVFLMLDEVIHEGVIFELDPTVITNRIHMQSGDAPEQTAFNQAISNAKENIMRSFLSGSS